MHIGRQFDVESSRIMPLPKVIIVGRPNVGKSSILNWLAKKRVAVVDPTAGVTRDRLAYVIQEQDRCFELIDTGGLGIEDRDNLTEEIERQIDIGIQEADLILFVTDGQAGVTPLDREVADRLRSLEKPKLLVINKCDSPRFEADIPEFYALTNAPAVSTSVTGNRNRKELLAAILEQLPPEDIDEAASAAEPVMKFAIVGRRNVGKSTFINALAKTERMIVSEVPGTTRDSVDVRFEFDDKVFIAIDTPGVRKRKSLADNIEFYGLVRAKQSIRRADVVLMFFDAHDTISRVDKQLVSEIEQHYKPCIFVVNKWDLGREEGMTTEAWSTYLWKSFGSLQHVPVAFVTASESRNAKKLINLAQTIFKQARYRVSTGRLNQVVRTTVDNQPPPIRKNKRPKIYFAVQVGITPPTIVLKCNDPSLFDKSWIRYLLGALRDELPFAEIPIKLSWRRKTRDAAEPNSLEEAAGMDSADVPSQVK